MVIFHCHVTFHGCTPFEVDLSPFPIMVSFLNVSPPTPLYFFGLLNTHQLHAISRLLRDIPSVFCAIPAGRISRNRWRWKWFSDSRSAVTWGLRVILGSPSPPTKSTAFCWSSTQKWAPFFAPWTKTAAFFFVGKDDDSPRSSNLTWKFCLEELWSPMWPISFHIMMCIFFQQTYLK